MILFLSTMLEFSSQFTVCLLSFFFMAFLNPNFWCLVYNIGLLSFSARMMVNRNRHHLMGQSHFLWNLELLSEDHRFIATCEININLRRYVSNSSIGLKSTKEKERKEVNSVVSDSWAHGYNPPGFTPSPWDSQARKYLLVVAHSNFTSCMA